MLAEKHQNNIVNEINGQWSRDINPLYGQQRNTKADVQTSKSQTGRKNYKLR